MLFSNGAALRRDENNIPLWPQNQRKQAPITAFEVQCERPPVPLKAYSQRQNGSLPKVLRGLMSNSVLRLVKHDWATIPTDSFSGAAEVEAMKHLARDMHVLNDMWRGTRV